MSLRSPLARLSWALLLFPLSAIAAEPGLEAMQAAAPVTAGLVVHLGTTDGSLALALAKAHPVVVLAVVADARSEAALRQTLVDAGVHGQAAVTRLADGRVPLVDDCAAVVVADLDALPELTRDEALRVARPFGRVWMKQGGTWRTIDKPRPSDVDDWGQYHYNAAMSDLSRDLRAGPAYGIQWQSGPQAGYSDGVRVAGAVALFLDGNSTVVARDAYSGLPIWHRADLSPRTRFTFMSDHQRVYIHPSRWNIPAPAMLALDARTGETVLEYTEGITFVPPEGGWPRDNKDPVRLALQARSKDLQARLTEDGRLLQIGGAEMVLLDAATGARRWARIAAEGKIWSHPIIHDGFVYAVEGPDALSYSYTHWPMAAVEAIRCFDLTTGADRWTYRPPEGRSALAAYNMTIGAGRLALVSRDRVAGKGRMVILILSAADGRETAFLDNGIADGKNEIGGGHSGARGNAIGDRLFISTIGGIPGSISLRNPTPDTIDRTYGRVSRPVGCTVFRFTPNWAFGSLTTYSLAGNRVLHTNSARTACDVGAFPANGLSYITPNHCFCLPYLPGSNAFHPRPFPGEETLERLETGTARPAARPLETSATSAWPMFLANRQRGAWVDDPLPAELKPIWQVKPAGDTAPPPMLAAAWAGHWYAHGPASQASVAGGVVVVAASHRQQIVAYDAATGTERWRRTVDGRVDTAPTIAGSRVVAGTRNGWVYALDLATGDLAWRFLAAPRRDRIVVDGQIESSWPVIGSVMVDPHGVWAVAGRHSETDGGLWWWRLDLASGRPLAQGRIGENALKESTTFAGVLNNPVVLDRDLFLLPGVTFQVADGELKPWKTSWESPSRWSEQDGWYDRFTRSVLTPGNQGLLSRVEFLDGYKLPQYGMTSGRLYVHKGDDFAMVGGAPEFQHRGGKGDSTIRRMRRYPQLTTVEIPDAGDATRVQRRIRGSEVVWTQGNLGLGRDNGISALAMAGDNLLVGLEVTNRDRWRERQEMPFRVQVLNQTDGTVRQELALPAKPLFGGIASDDGRVFVVTDDGTLSAFGP